MNKDNEKNKLEQIFSAFDKNGDGILDYQDLVDGFTIYYEGDKDKAQHQALEILDKLDFN